MIGLFDATELLRLSEGGNILYAVAGCVVVVFGAASSVCLKAALKNRKLNKRYEEAVKMQEVIVESLRQKEIAQKNRLAKPVLPADCPEGSGGSQPVNAGDQSDPIL